MFNQTQKKINYMEKKAYQTPLMEVVTVSSLSMLALSDIDSNVFDGYDGEHGGAGRSNKRRGWANEW